MQKTPIEIELIGGPLDGLAYTQANGFVFCEALHRIEAACDETECDAASLWRFVKYRLEFDEPRVPSITPQGRYRYVFECYA